MPSSWEDFYANAPKPSDFEENEKLVKNFVELHAKENTKVVLVTVSRKIACIIFHFYPHIKNFC